MAPAQGGAMTIAVIGYGLIGRERVKALDELHKQGFPVDRILVFDPDAFRSTIPSLPEIAAPVHSLRQAISCDPSLVIIATPHDTAVELLREILPSAARVLLEKPLGRSLEEANSIISELRSPDQLLVGFNYRFFPGIRQVLRDAWDGRFGTLISTSITLGHGGAPGMDKSWKFDPVRGGGGCLIDPGIHLLDLCNLLAQDDGPQLVGGSTWAGFWNTGIEEEAHLLLKSREMIFNLDISVVRWRSTFRMEIHGTEGYGIVTGRGRSYGRQIYVRGRRWAWQNGLTQADSEEIVIDSEANASFRDEIAAILKDDSGSPPPCCAASALRAMELYEQCRICLGLAARSTIR
jgi:predicted dehydrogenase